MRPLPPPPPGGRTSIKQAKANFKSRNYCPITDRQKKQLERAVALDRRAWGAREADKRKTEAAKKREEKARLEREAREKVMLDSQWRCDRFGYKSSQMQLGAFFGENAGTRRESNGVVDVEDKENVDLEYEHGLQDESEAEVEVASGIARKPKEDSFGDGDIDDETLLGALGAAENINSPIWQAFQSNSEWHAPPNPSIGIVSNEQLVPTVDLGGDMDSFWDQLDSSTQISRELNEPTKFESTPQFKSAPTPERNPVPHSVPGAKLNPEINPDTKSKSERPLARISSFGSDDFDISVDDIEESLLPFDEPATKAVKDRRLMPPPILLASRTPLMQKQPSITQKLSSTVASASAWKSSSRPAVPSHFTTKFDSGLWGHEKVMAAGFTLSELENFVDDDLQLTQATPG